MFREGKADHRRSALLHNRPDFHLTLRSEALDAILDTVLDTYSPTPLLDGVCLLVEPDDAQHAKEGHNKSIHDDTSAGSHLRYSL